MKNSEKRLLPRVPLGDVPHGSLTLVCRTRRLVIERLRDISNSGISFSLSQAVQKSEQISIEYVDSKVKLEVFGRVAWCSATTQAPQLPHHAPHYLLGVELLSPMMLFAVLPKA
jgi:PilZ domain